MAHQTADGRVYRRIGEALDAVDVVLGQQLPGARQRQIPETVEAGDPVSIQPVVGVVAVVAPGERGMRLVADAGLDRELVLRKGRAGGIGIRGQGRSVRVQPGDPRHVLERQGREPVGPLEIVILQGRFVDLPGKGYLIGTVGLCRVEVVRPGRK